MSSAALPDSLFSALPQFHASVQGFSLLHFIIFIFISYQIHTTLSIWWRYYKDRIGAIADKQSLTH